MTNRIFVNLTLKDLPRSVAFFTHLSYQFDPKVNDLVSKALAAGETATTPAKDHGNMYQHGFQDLDGHLWEPIYMAPGANDQP